MCDAAEMEISERVARLTALFEDCATVAAEGQDRSLPAAHLMGLCRDLRQLVCRAGEDLGDLKMHLSERPGSARE